MNKVMTRAQHRPGGRPPARRDARRPGGAPPSRPTAARTAPASPPRTPAGRTTSAPSPDRRRPGVTARSTRPADNRPPVRDAVPQPRPTDRFAELLLAVLSGQRPVHAMLRHTAGRAYDELVRLAERGPLRTRGVRPVVRDIGWFEPREGAIEAFARIGAGDRLRAMAFRLEQGRDLRWRCTAVELGGPRPGAADGR
ncbi:Rv3235 family protein [Streptomyces fungicidicus]